MAVFAKHDRVVDTPMAVFFAAVDMMERAVFVRHAERAVLVVYPVSDFIFFAESVA